MDTIKKIKARDLKQLIEQVPGDCYVTCQTIANTGDMAILGDGETVGVIDLSERTVEWFNEEQATNRKTIKLTIVMSPECAHLEDFEFDSEKCVHACKFGGKDLPYGQTCSECGAVVLMEEATEE